ncbi:balbiani ring protein 3-like isoform X1 [Penaeus japonicus]|uniref:balbiani ring protein 3-like isoform X1 n=1 Tax=Penaeus japonicus TaxID=27405 RepID=UPI001C7157A6|nr:balbiani ring protein 3-like isoform X1 [Penaeus japonicus]
MGTSSVLGVVVAALVLAASTEGRRVCSPLTCPEPNGLFAHPTDCHRYVKCMNGHAYAENCPANLHFNEASGSCDHPENAKCDINKRLETEGCSLRSPKARSLPGETDFSVECNCDCCMKPHKDCNKYYECKDNVAYVKECGGDLVFNPALEQCDLPTNYECPKPVICGCHCRYPVDDECNAYYDCRNGEAEKKYCTEGLLFNPDTRMCDIAENVDCPTTPPTQPPTGCHDNVHDSDPDCKFWAANNDCHCKWTDGDCSWQHFVARACPRSCACQGHVNATSRPVIDFPCVDCSSGQQYWQHPSDCRKFIQCAPYGPQEMPCGEGTVWDQNLLTCNHEWATQCLTGNFLLADGSCSGCSGCTPPAQTTARPSQKPVTPGNFSCVDCSTGQQYWQHPSDCHKFIQCAPYGPQEMPCPAGTRWDQKILTCNHEQNTPCVTGNYLLPNGSCSGCTGCPDVITPRPDGCSGDHPDCKFWAANGDCTCKPHTDCTWQNQVAAMCPKTCRGECGQATPPTGGCNFVCPSYSGLFPHPKDCTKWVHCDHFIPHVKDCPATLHFNPTLKVCDWPDRAGCTSGEHESCVIPTEPVPTGPPSTSSPDCTCECCHIPHTEDCTSYYYCDVNRNKTFHTCSQGLVFNPEMGTCVFAEEYPECVTEKPPVCECDCHYPSNICSEYYICNNRVPEKKECPSGLLWNQEKKSCDLPENVQCNTPRK